MDLHIKDRLLIPSIFPERGNFMDFNLKKSIARKIAISEQDRKDYEIVEKKEEKRIEWNVQKDAETPLVVEFSKEELDYMRRSCEAIAEQQMPDEMWAVVERIYNEAQNLFLTSLLTIISSIRMGICLTVRIPIYCFKLTIWL